MTIQDLTNQNRKETQESLKRCQKTLEEIKDYWEKVLKQLKK